MQTPAKEVIYHTSPHRDPKFKIHIDHSKSRKLYPRTIKWDNKTYICEDDIGNFSPHTGISQQSQTNTHGDRECSISPQMSFTVRTVSREKVSYSKHDLGLDYYVNLKCN